MAARSKASVCCRMPPEIVGSNPTGGMDGCLLCFVRQRPVRRADHSSRGVLPTVCVVECNLETSRMRRPFPTGWGGGSRARKQTKQNGLEQRNSYKFSANIGGKNFAW